MSTGRGYAKVILFGEHFVVYGIPAIASGIDKFVDVKVEKDKHPDIFFHDTIFKEDFSRSEQPDHVTCKLFDALFADRHLSQIRVTISGTAIPQSGMGYSAALAVALARAVGKHLALDWSDQQVNEIAYKGECVAHGNPSGIDNACATYGSLVWFEKDLAGKHDILRPFRPKKPLHLVLVDTGIRHSTRENVEEVRKRKGEDPARFKNIFSSAEKLVHDARHALEKGDLAEIGALMNVNQELLRQIGVSCKEIEEILKHASAEGVLGGKITGAGNGGFVLLLCRDKQQQQQRVAAAFSQKNYRIITTDIS